MTHFEKIELIRNENKLSVTAFLEKTGIPRSSYYALKKGEMKSLTHKLAKKIVWNFRAYKYDWLMFDAEKVISNLNEDTLELYNQLPTWNSINNLKQKLELIELELTRIYKLKNLVTEILIKKLEETTDQNKIANNKKNN